MKQDLINPDLFGNDAGEDEHPTGTEQLLP